MRVLISKKTRDSFREFLVTWTLAEIMSEFDDAGIDASIEFQPTVSGQRRTLVEQYYHSIDFTNPNDVQRIIRAYENVLLDAELRSIEISEQAVFLERDGFVFREGRLIPNRPEVAKLMASASQPDIDETHNHKDDLELWGQGQPRLFLSHKDNYKGKAALLKMELQQFGVSCFVAHTDIAPTRKWLQDLERALRTMDVLVALLTSDFSESDWTDQEVGAAVGRKVPVLPVMLRKNPPHGFAGKFQAMLGLKDMKAMAASIYDLLWSIPELDTRMTDGIIARFENSDSFEESNFIMANLRRVKKASTSQIERIENAYRTNIDLSKCFKVQRELPGLLRRLKAV